MYKLILKTDSSSSSCLGRLIKQEKYIFGKEQKLQAKTILCIKFPQVLSYVGNPYKQVDETHQDSLDPHTTKHFHAP